MEPRRIESRPPPWVRGFSIALGLMLVGVGLAVAWIAWSLASEGVIRSGRRVMLPLERTQDPAAFWLFVSIQVILAAGAIIAGCRLVFDGVRRYRMPR